MHRTTRLLCFCLLSLLLASAAFGQMRKATCTGTVLDAGGAAVPGAEVTFLEWRSDDLTAEMEANVVAGAVCDANGAFALSASFHPDADAVVVAHKKGQAIGWAWIAKPQKNLVTLRLGKPASLDGVVVDEANKPVAGAEVRCQPYVQGPTDLIYLPLAASLEFNRAKTDKDGRFRFDDLPARSRVRLDVSAPGKATMTTLDDCYADEWAGCPNAAGESNVRVVMAPEAVIEGKVVEKGSNKPVAGVAVFVMEPVLASPLPVVTDKDGNFRIGGLSEGARTVEVVEPKDRLAEWTPASKDANARAGKTQSVVLEVSKGGVLEVTVLDADSNKPVAGAEVTASRSGGGGASGVQINAAPGLAGPAGLVGPAQVAVAQAAQAGAPAAGDANEEPVSRTGITDAAGVARLRLPPGTYSSISASKAREFDEENADESVTVEEGKTAKARITLSMPYTHMAGVVRDPNGRAVAGAVIRAAGQYSGLVTYGLAGATGGFGADVLEKDEGKIAVFVQDVERNLAAVEVLDDPEETKVVTLAPARTIRGLVVDESNKPLSIAAVSITGEIERGSVEQQLPDFDGEAVVDEKGRYEIRALLPGQYTLKAHACGYGEVELSIEVPADGNETVVADDLTLLPADQSVSGTVVDEKGKPVPGALVSVGGDGQLDRNGQAADEAGKFTIRKLVKGTVTVSAIGDGMEGQIEVEAGEKDAKVVIRKENAGPPMKSGEDF